LENEERNSAIEGQFRVNSQTWLSSDCKWGLASKITFHIVLTITTLKASFSLRFPQFSIPKAIIVIVDDEVVINCSEMKTLTQPRDGYFDCDSKIRMTMTASQIRREQNREEDELSKNNNNCLFSVQISALIKINWM
jgi:hypothetical protein